MHPVFTFLNDLQDYHLKKNQNLRSLIFYIMAQSSLMEEDYGYCQNLKLEFQGKSGILSQIVAKKMSVFWVEKSLIRLKKKRFLWKSV